MIDARLYKEFSDASEIIQIEEGHAICNFIDTEGRRVIVNGKEASGDYIAKAGDVIIVRTIPGAAAAIGIGIAFIVVAVGGLIMAGAGQVYMARKQAQELEDRLKGLGLNDSVTNRPDLKGASNSMAKNKTQPYIMGTHLFTPYMLTPAHYKISGTDGDTQHYFALLEAGFKSQILRNLSADDVVLRSFTDIIPQEGQYTLDHGTPFYDATGLIEVSQDGNAFTETEFNSVYSIQAPGSELKKADDDAYEHLVYTLPEFAASTEIIIRFRGLRAHADDGTKIDRTVEVIPQVSFNGGASWILQDFDQNGTPSNTFTRNTSNELRFSCKVNFTYSQVTTKTAPIMVRISCTTNKYTGTALDQVYVDLIQSTLYDPDATASAGSIVLEKPLGTTEASLSTRVGIKLKATESNKDKLGKINIVTSGVARTWTGSAWTTTKSPTSNLAAWILEVLTSDTHLPSKILDEEIDLDSFGEFYEYCETNDVNVNQVLLDGDEKSNVISALCDIGSCLLYQNIYGEIAVAVDSVKENAIGVLNTQNLLSFEVEREFSRQTDGIRINFINADADYQEDEYLVMRQGVTRDADSIIRDISVSGITDYDQVVKYARRLMAMETLRPRTITASVGKEGVYYTPLSKILVQHPALSNGLGSAEIQSVITEAGYITGVTLYEPVMYDSGVSLGYGVIIQAVDDTYCTPLAKQYTAESDGLVREIYFTSPIIETSPVVPHPGDVLSYGYLSGGEFDTITSEMLIIDIQQTDTGHSLKLVDYNEAIYDYGTIPTYTPNLTYTPQAVDAPSGIPLEGPPGLAGEPGADGVGVQSVSITYQVGTSPTTPPTGTWTSTPGATSAGQYLWTRTITTYTDATTSTAYSVAAHGATGDPGEDGADGASSLGLGFILNAATFSAEGSNTGEIYLHGYNPDGTAADIDGFIFYKNAKITVTRGQVNPNLAFDGYLLAPVSGGTVIPAIFRISNQTWYSLAGGTITALTEANYFAIGEMINTAAEATESALLYPTGRNLVDIRTAIEAKYIGIAGAVTNGSGTVSVYQAISATQFSASGVSRRARPGTCAFVRGGTLNQAGSADSVKALRVFDGYYWEAPRTEDYAKYRNLALYDLLGVARIYDAGGYAVPTDCGTFFDLLMANQAVIDYLMVNKLKVGTGGSIRGGDRYNEDGSVANYTKDGFHLSYDGKFQGNLQGDSSGKIIIGSGSAKSPYQTRTVIVGNGIGTTVSAGSGYNTIVGHEAVPTLSMEFGTCIGAKAGRGVGPITGVVAIGYNAASTTTSDYFIGIGMAANQVSGGGSHQINLGNRLRYLEFPSTATQATVYSALSPLMIPTLLDCGAFGTFGGTVFNVLYRVSSTQIRISLAGFHERITLSSSSGTAIGQDLQIALVQYQNV